MNKLEKMPHILIVDDNQINRDVLVRLLSNENFLCHTAESGETALALSEQMKFDLIIIDLSMPDMDGYETVQRMIRQGKQPQALYTALTARLTEESITRCQKIGIHSCFEKPLPIGKLIDHFYTTFPAKKRLSPQIPQAAFNKHPANDLDIFKIASSQRLHDLARIQKETHVNAFFHQVLNQFLRQTLPVIAQIQKQHESNELKGLKEQIHSLAGACAVLGVDHLATTCNAIESQLNQKPDELPTALLSQLQQDYQKAQLIIKDFHVDEEFEYKN